MCNSHIKKSVYMVKNRSYLPSYVTESIYLFGIFNSFITFICNRSYPLVTKVRYMYFLHIPRL